MSEKAMLTEEEPLNKNGADNNNKGGKLRFITSSGAVIVPDAKPFISDRSHRALASLQAYLDAGSHHAPVLPAAADVTSPHPHTGIFECFRGILHEGAMDKRVQFLIEGLFALRKAKFQGHPAVRPELDLVELEDQVTHQASLLDEVNAEDDLVVFKLDPEFLENEKRYEDLKKTILGDEADGGDDDESSQKEESDGEQMKPEQIWLTFEEVSTLPLCRVLILRKLVISSSKSNSSLGKRWSCAQCCWSVLVRRKRTGVTMGQKFCMINRVYQENLEKCFVQQYSMVHRLETNKLRNVAIFFAHLLGTDALPWHVLASRFSSSIITITTLEELSEHLGVQRLKERLSDPSFSINFFTSIGLGGITEELRGYLKSMHMQQLEEDLSHHKRQRRSC